MIFKCKFLVCRLFQDNLQIKRSHRNGGGGDTSWVVSDRWLMGGGDAVRRHGRRFVGYRFTKCLVLVFRVSDAINQPIIYNASTCTTRGVATERPPKLFHQRYFLVFFIVSVVCICWPSLSTLELKYSAVLEHQYNGRWSIHI